MNDKEKIKEFLVGIASAAYRNSPAEKVINNIILPYIDSMQEEPDGLKPKFEEGDIIRHICTGNEYQIIEVSTEVMCYGALLLPVKGYPVSIDFENQDAYMLIEERPEPISPADVGLEALGKWWDEEAKKVSGELTHPATKINEKEEPVSEDFEKALAVEWQGYIDRGAATVDALEDNTQELAFAKGFYRAWHYRKEESKPKFKVGQKITDGKETVIVSELLDGGSIRVDTKLSGDCWYDIDVNEVDKWKLVEEPISEDLLDEIHNRWEDDLHTKWPKCPYKDFKNIACHFANWQRQQQLRGYVKQEDYVSIQKLCYDNGFNACREQIMKGPKLSGWVARDENGNLHIFDVEPSRLLHRWWDRDYHSTGLDNKDFPELKWEDEPVYVKLPIIKEE